LAISDKYFEQSNIFEQYSFAIFQNHKNIFGE